MKRVAAQLRTTVRELVDELNEDIQTDQSCEVCGASGDIGVLLIATNVLPKQLNERHVGEICVCYRLCQFHRATASGLVMQILAMIVELRKKVGH